LYPASGVPLSGSFRESELKRGEWFFDRAILPEKGNADLFDFTDKMSAFVFGLKLQLALQSGQPIPV
jgi:hypothetical protein